MLAGEKIMFPPRAPSTRYRSTPKPSSARAAASAAPGTLSATVAPGQPGEGLAQDLFLFTERKPDLGPAGLLVVVEHRTRDGDHAGPARKLAAELHAVLFAGAADVSNDEEGARRLVHLEARLGQARAQQVTLHPQVSGD